jgi:putative ABC transport system permease protein
MFMRMMLRSAMYDRSRSSLAVVAVVVAVAVSTALLNLYSDLDTKLHKEFRNYGANVVLTSDADLAADAIARIDAILPPGSVAAPFAYAVVKLPNQTPVILAATDFARTKRLDGWWGVSAWPQRSGEGLVGVRAKKQLAPNGADFQLSYADKSFTIQPAGTLETGGDEDSRVYISLSDLEQWTGIRPSVVEIAVPGSTADVEAAATRLKAAIPNARVEPIRQVVEAEANVLNKTRGVLLGAVVVVIVLATMCLLATLTTSVLDRRKDFAVMRALGATRATLHGLFLAETSMYAAIGCAAGMLLGMALAMWIGRVNFHAAVTPRWTVLPVVLAGTLLVAAAAAAIPMILLGKVQPATLLRGD